MEQAELFGARIIPGASAAADFDGETYTPEVDRDRLAGQLQRVFHLMHDGRWRTLAEISGATGGSEAAVSARLRDLRKAKFGAWTVQRRRIDGGLYEYRVSSATS